MVKRLAAFFSAMVVGCYIALGIGSAFAQAVTSGGVDFTPTAEKIIAACVAVLTIGASIVSKFAVGWFSSKTKLNDSEFERLAAARVNDILLRAIEYAEMTAKAYVSDPNSSIKSVKIDNMFLRWGIDYAQRSMPDLIRYFGLTEDRIRELLLARLNSVVNVPEVDSADLTPVAVTFPPVNGNS